MKMKLIFLCTVLFAISNAAVFNVPAPANKDYEGCRYSKYPETAQMTADQEVQIVGKCLKAICDKTGSIQIQGCSPIHVEPPATISATDYTKPYPDCCPQPVKV